MDKTVLPTDSQDSVTPNFRKEGITPKGRSEMQDAVVNLGVDKEELVSVDTVYNNESLRERSKEVTVCLEVTSEMGSVEKGKERFAKHCGKRRPTR